MPDFRHYPHAHDYRVLVRRWRQVARRRGFRVRTYSRDEAGPLIFVSGPARSTGPLVYLSAGIHGDEPAATEALIAWFEKAPLRLLRRLRFDIFPCLNPWGLVSNSRWNSARIDLNRSYRSNEIATTVAHRELLQGKLYDLALTLHEDYDAQGIYLYEPLREKSTWAESLLAAASMIIPIDPRPRIESSTARDGIVRRKVDLDFMPDQPEALFLHFAGSRHTFTIETPSEADLALRVAAHAAMLDEAIHLVLTEQQKLRFAAARSVR